MRAQRKKALEQMLVADPRDAFALYGLAMEIKGEEATRAIALLRALLEVEPGHLYGHYQLGEVLLSVDRVDDAETTLDAGIVQAERAGDAKAASELRALRAEI